MHSPLLRGVAAALVFTLLGAMSTPADAQDTPGEPAAGEPAQQEPPAPKPDDAPAPPAAPSPDEPKPDAPKPETPKPAAATEPGRETPPTDAEDAAARKVLVEAAERQGGKTLAPPDGSLTSFRIIFHKVTVFRDSENSGGGSMRQRIDSDDDGLEVHWMGAQLRTVWRLSSESPVARGVKLKQKPDGTWAELAWLHDGQKQQFLGADERFAKDREQLDRDRRIVKTLLDVAILRRLLTDGSRWKIVDDPLHEGTALTRTPPAGADTPLRVTLWIDPATHDVTAARLAPNEPGESTMHYSFEYMTEFPKVEGAELRFPAKFKVFEQRIPEQAPMPVMEGFARLATFNDLTQADLDPASPVK